MAAFLVALACWAPARTGEPGGWGGSGHRPFPAGDPGGLRGAIRPEDYAFPARIDPADRYLFLSAWEDRRGSGTPGGEYGVREYRYKAILEALREYGFVVLSELRPRGADPEEFAARLAGQIEELMDAGVPPGSITVIGASKGAAIAVLASHRLADPDLGYVLLGSCHPDLLEGMGGAGHHPHRRGAGDTRFRRQGPRRLM